jgi:hypothetical protein
VPRILQLVSLVFRKLDIIYSCFCVGLFGLVQVQIYLDSSLFSVHKYRNKHGMAQSESGSDARVRSQRLPS